ncbi:VOC family protein [Streptomyces sp. JJ38]|uniref:VOC family protein n=1 Tax=Streptomyces sp. JJ38 TaxID=2738128 RepID=UPI001C57017E|nr:VOC family protein [Streptomyces sp. JJ38]MBW1595717.1 VOC family protein [Streptomyces sp. JJ38]
MAIAEFGLTAIDCPEPRVLADFYSAVLGWETDPESREHDWIEIVGPDGRRLAFQRSEGYRAPKWPSTEHAQQMHLDFDVPRERLEEAERAVLELGATLLEGDDGGQRNWRVYADPVGHPFCLCAQ